MIHQLENTVQHYAWGSRTALAELRGAASPSPEPEAELWMGAHSGAPSRVERNGAKVTLSELIAESPASLLGARNVQRFGNELPFLLKLLAAAAPLSLQAHPTAAQAQVGFAAEESGGVPLSAATRNYKDPHHKPELIAALTPFWALSGFRDVVKTRALFAELDCKRLSPHLVALSDADPGTALRSTFRALMSIPTTDRSALVNEMAGAMRRASEQGSDFERELDWGLRLAALHPNDIGVVCALLLNLVQLTPGEAIYLPAGNLHAYLEGVGVEVMASSDNVLRGGLTPKHVDVPELLRILDFRELDVKPLIAVAVNAFERVYRTSAAEFQLSQIRVEDEIRVADRNGPEILLGVRGQVTVAGATSVRLAGGESAFVSAQEPAFVLRGSGTLFRARVPE